MAYPLPSVGDTYFPVLHESPFSDGVQEMNPLGFMNPAGSFGDCFPGVLAIHNGNEVHPWAPARHPHGSLPKFKPTVNADSRAG